MIPPKGDNTLVLISRFASSVLKYSRTGDHNLSMVCKLICLR